MSASVSHILTFRAWKTSDHFIELDMRSFDPALVAFSEVKHPQKPEVSEIRGLGDDTTAWALAEGNDVLRVQYFKAGKIDFRAPSARELASVGGEEKILDILQQKRREKVSRFVPETMISFGGHEARCSWPIADGMEEKFANLTVQGTPAEVRGKVIGKLVELGLVKSVELQGGRPLKMPALDEDHCRC